MKLSSKGLITIPGEVRNESELSSGDIVELIVVQVYKLRDILGERTKVYEYLITKGYKVTTPEEELVGVMNEMGINKSQFC
ncbi:AbrB/MazE/SpoVT family DNA-binding domain-containing protein [Thermococcus argininiproducens]|uniref:AbrB/MazE/SpoVT family DNA-binding domain-containing protein n=1 Tax=Thermococcus argininiproducens TaxID=2866384 RepID=A0A9E7M9K3_9EURY|nr:AbrB/MazE/SpoVT family DNA-binding domain-containing protein [Thermococcus argininiproducens]USG99835.1 AbrB/MazE/SpoVT family DNA-binding domain-containing protein [Thermococcus argininiproducens]